MLKLVVSHPDSQHVLVRFFDRAQAGGTWAFCGMITLSLAGWGVLEGILTVGSEGAPPEFLLEIEQR